MSVVTYKRAASECMSDLAPAEKRCRDCGEVKPASAFWRRKQSPDGLALYCRQCFGLRNAVKYRKMQAAIGKGARAYRRHSAVPEGMKYCPHCAEIKSIDEFGRNRANTSGRAAYCKPCHNRAMAEIKAKKHGSVRGYHLQRRYGLTEQDMMRLGDQQASLCLICLHRHSLHVDHDHASGDFRGLLCFRCNGGLGQFKDDPRAMRAAVDYLEGRLVERFESRAGVRRAPRGQRRTRRHYRLTERYGIGEDDVARLIERQGGLCPICRKATPTAVDHDHVTGAVRGILCGDCNTGMGQLRDDPWVLRRAIEYLTGGLSGLRRTDDGGFAVTAVRPRGSGPVTDPVWDIGNIGAHDLAILHALSRGDSGEPWEIDAGVGEPAPSEPRFDAARRRPLRRCPAPGRASGSRGVCILLMCFLIPKSDPHPAG